MLIFEVLLHITPVAVKNVQKALVISEGGSSRVCSGGKYNFVEDRNLKSHLCSGTMSPSLEVLIYSFSSSPSLANKMEIRETRGELIIKRREP